MSTTVSYKNNILTTIGFDDSATLNTQGTWLEDNITINVGALNIQSLTVTPNENTQTFNSLIQGDQISVNSVSREATITTPGLYYVTATGFRESAFGVSYPGTYSFEFDGTAISNTQLISGYAALNSIVLISQNTIKFNVNSSYDQVTINSLYKMEYIDGYLPVTINPIPSNYVIPTGTLQISGNGTYDVSSYASAVVNAASAINNQNKTVTPSESQQTISADSGYTGLGTVTVNAISNTYVGSAITRRSSNDLSASSATVTVPAGYYASQATKTVSNGALYSCILDFEPYLQGEETSISFSVDNNGVVSAYYYNNSVPVENIVQTAGWINTDASGYAVIALSDDYQLPTQAATTIVPTTSSQTAVTAGKYTTGTITVAAIPSNYVDASSLKTYYTGSSAPSSSLGANGDLYFQTSEV